MKRRGAWIAGAFAAATYLLVLPGWGPGDAVVAALVALISVRISRAGAEASPSERLTARLGASSAGGALGLTLRVLADGVRGTWSIARLVLGHGSVPRPGLVEVPVGEHTELEAAALGILVAVPPGSLLVRVDAERRVLLFHVVGATPGEFRESVESLARGSFRRTLGEGDGP